MSSRDVSPRQSATRYNKSRTPYNNAYLYGSRTAYAPRYPTRATAALSTPNPPGETLQVPRDSRQTTVRFEGSTNPTYESHREGRDRLQTLYPDSRPLYDGREHRIAGQRHGAGPVVPYATRVATSIDAAPSPTASFNTRNHLGPQRSRHLDQGRALSRNVGYVDSDIPDVEHGKLSPNFRYQRRECFQKGVVFKAYWSEPSGNSNNITRVVYTSLGEPVFSKIRLFVVVEVHHNFCTCLSIQTYSDRGAAGRFTELHSIAYTTLGIPLLQESERGYGGPPMGEAIHVEPNRHWKYLEATSRINFEKPYPVESNVKTYIFGRVRPDDMSKLIEQYISCRLGRGNEQLLPPAPHYSYHIDGYHPELASASNCSLVPGSNVDLSGTIHSQQSASRQAPISGADSITFHDANMREGLPIAFADSADLSVDTQPMLLDLANNGIIEDAMDEQQVSPVTLERPETVVMNWGLSRLAIAAPQEDREQTEDYVTLDHESSEMQHEEDSPHPILSG